MAYLILVAVLVAVMGSSYAYIKNQHVKKGQVKRTLERQIDDLETESDQLKRSLTSRLDRFELSRNLTRFNSQLVKIPPGAVVTLNSEPTSADPRRRLDE